MIMTTLKGSPREIGKAYGEKFKEQIQKNIRQFVDPNRDDLIARPGFQAWKARYDAEIGVEIPWYREEMLAVAEAAEVDYDSILLLNLRSWQYNLYSDLAEDDCSSFIMRLSDGVDVNAGALDDPAEVYCGPVRYVPDNGYTFVSFPLTGTSWGNRGMNSAGLAMGISSQRLPGMRSDERMWSQDVAMRVILQTCETVEEVREFCNKHYFTINLVVSDARGGRLCIHNTVAGPVELPEGEYAAMTNHVVCDKFFNRFTDQGVTAFPESDTTRKRRSRLINLIEQREGKADFDEVLAFLEKRYPDADGSIWNDRSIVLTAACPMKDKNGLWLLYPTLNGDHFEKIDIVV